ncbi:MAG: 16S rRNA (cytosine(1402)-N(4))-methyltransferase RsmH [Nitrospirota bacterium]
MRPQQHLPVMAEETLAFLDVREDGVYVDATVGPGGHSERILEHLGREGALYCLDRDEEALALARERLGDGRCRFRKARFGEMGQVLREEGLREADGVLMDLGVSMLQMKAPERGMSFASDAPLDMRMDRSQALRAEDIVNSWSEKELADLIYTYGEETRSRRVARAIVQARKHKRLTTCRELTEVVSAVLPRRGRTHPATRTFQALRMAVNDELGELERGLPQALALLKPGGRLAVIAYHSLEDRAVKNFMRREKEKGSLRVLTKKPVVARREEVLSNPSARSAKLRAAEAVR